MAYYFVRGIHPPNFISREYGGHFLDCKLLLTKGLNLDRENNIWGEKTSH